MTVSRDWLDLLRRAAERETIAGVAERVGLSRSTISLVLAGKYPAKSLAGVEQKVRDALDSWLCPYYGIVIRATDCRAWRERPMPQSSARDIRFWRACQSCSHNPDAPSYQQPSGERQHASKKTSTR